MSPNFASLIKHLKARTAEIELDIPGPQSSASAEIASQLARSRRAAINRGDRVARVYTLDGGKRVSHPEGIRPESEMLISDTECRILAAAGAKWVGPELYMPKPRPYIERLNIRSYRCIQQIDIPLTPLHAFIGPNDSGKSTLLQAVESFVTGVGPSGFEVTVQYRNHALTQFWLKDGRQGSVAHDASVTLEAALNGANDRDPTTNATLRALVSTARVLRLDPDSMRDPTNLIPQSHPIQFDARGKGLAAVYDALLSRRLDAFLEISKRFVALFPTVKSIQLTNPSQTTKALSIELRAGPSVEASQLSEGMLYWLAFAALPYLDPVSLILIEEPENGLHPSRISEVMQVLRDASTSAQVMIATHSPLVINELQPDEVTLITRPPTHGATVATPLSRTKNFEQRAKVYALGELWLNYADGDFEQELVAESTLPQKSADAS